MARFGSLREQLQAVAPAGDGDTPDTRLAPTDGGEPRKVPEIEGLRLRNAIFVYADDLEEARAIRALWQDRMNLEWREKADLDRGLYVLKTALRDKLRTRQFRLCGFVLGDPEMKEADPYWCTRADFEPDDDTARAHGVTLHDVRVFPGILQARPAAIHGSPEPRAASDLPEKRTRKQRKNVSVETVRRWFLDQQGNLPRRGDGRLPQPDAIKAAIEAKNCSRDAARAAYARLPDDLRAPAVRPKKSAE